MSARLSANLLLDYLIELGSGLMSAGCPTYRLEEVLNSIAEHEGFTCDVFALPTGLFISVRTPTGEPPAMQMVRVTEWGTNLRQLADLDEVLNQVAARRLSVADALNRIRAFASRPDSWPTWSRLAAATGASAGAAVSFGGSGTDFFLAGAGGLVLAAINHLGRATPARFLQNFLGGIVAALAAWLTTWLSPAHSREVMVLSVIIPLLPGLVLTTGLAELTYRNLVAGTARLMEAGVTLLSLIFGIALVLGLEAGLGLTPEPAAPLSPASAPWQVLALIVASVSFGVLLGLPRHWRWMSLSVLSGAVVWLSNALTRPMPGIYAAFVTANVLALLANVYARLTRRPAQLFLLPGLLLLVPGVFGFRSLEALLRRDYAVGVSQFTDMFLTAGALVMGLLVANVVVPSRKSL